MHVNHLNKNYGKQLRAAACQLVRWPTLRPFSPFR